MLESYKSAGELSKTRRMQLLLDYRDIKVSHREPFFPKNSISTTKYTLSTFLFINLYEQFSKLANVYFLFLAVLQVIPAISLTGGSPNILLPLLTIVFITMIKDGYEDYKRYKSDQEENNKETILIRGGQENVVKWKDVLVGDVLMVKRDEFFPADLILLASSHYKKGQCFIETKNLDGETNLKTKYIQSDLQGKIKSKEDVHLYY